MEIFSEMWFWSYLFGVYLGYMVMSPKLRGFTWKCVVASVHGLNRFVDYCNGVKKPARTVAAEPEQSDDELAEQIFGEPVTANDRGVVVTNMDELKKWLKNPDVKVRVPDRS